MKVSRIIISAVILIAIGVSAYGDIQAEKETVKGISDFEKGSRVNLRNYKESVGERDYDYRCLARFSFSIGPYGYFIRPYQKHIGPYGFYMPYGKHIGPYGHYPFRRYNYWFSNQNYYSPDDYYY